MVVCVCVTLSVAAVVPARASFSSIFRLFFLHSRTISHLLFIDGRCVSDAQIEGEQEKITEDKVKQQRQSRT